MMPVPAFTPETGVPLPLASGVQLVLAPNPSPMTYLGTNSYVIGTDTLAVIDPGPAAPAHLAALLAAIDNRPVSHILVTHSHLDHSPLARPLSDRTGAPIYAFGNSHAGRSAVMQALSSAGYTGGGEGMDWEFSPDHLLADGEVIHVADKPMQAIHTPGHIGNHLCFKWGDAVFTGDHVMGWATSLVSPPDGDMTDFLESCAKLHKVPAEIYYPGHGAPVTEPRSRLEALVTHRKSRETQILATLARDSKTVIALTQAIYTDVAPALFPAASRNVFAHLVDLHRRGIVAAHPTLAQDAVFNRTTAD